MTRKSRVQPIGKELESGPLAVTQEVYSQSPHKPPGFPGGWSYQKELLD